MPFFEAFERLLDFTEQLEQFAFVLQRLREKLVFVGCQIVGSLAPDLLGFVIHGTFIRWQSTLLLELYVHVEQFNPGGLTMLTAHRAALLLILLRCSRSIPGLDNHIAVFIFTVYGLFES